jgi:peptidoglycan/LPS O-acetylase OafA/YrhL
MILLTATASTILVSWLSYRYVELPAIRCGKSFSARWERRKTQADIFGLGAGNANLEHG